MSSLTAPQGLCETYVTSDPCIPSSRRVVQDCPPPRISAFKPPDPAFDWLYKQKAQRVDPLSIYVGMESSFKGRAFAITVSIATVAPTWIVRTRLIFAGRSFRHRPIPGSGPLHSRRNRPRLRSRRFASLIALVPVKCTLYTIRRRHISFGMPRLHLLHLGPPGWSHQLRRHLPF